MNASGPANRAGFGTYEIDNVAGYMARGSTQLAGYAGAEYMQMEFTQPMGASMMMGSGTGEEEEWHANRNRGQQVRHEGNMPTQHTMHHGGNN